MLENPPAISVENVTAADSYKTVQLPALTQFPAAAMQGLPRGGLLELPHPDRRPVREIIESLLAGHFQANSFKSWIQ